MQASPDPRASSDEPAAERELVVARASGTPARIA
jgi:hypothetical protein